MPWLAGGADGGPGAVSAYADASLHGRDAAWAAVVYDGERLVRASLGAGEAPTIGEAERRAILLAARLMEDLGRRGPIYSDSREAVAAAQALVLGHEAVTAVIWTPAAYNRAADVLSKIVRQTWQRLRKRRAVPTMLSARTPSYAPLRSADGLPRRAPATATPAGGAQPRTLEQAILSLASAGGIVAAELVDHIEARWPDLLALRGRPEHSVRDALDSLLRRGEVVLDTRGAVTASRAATAEADAGRRIAPEP